MGDTKVRSVFSRSPTSRSKRHSKVSKTPKASGDSVKLAKPPHCADTELTNLIPPSIVSAFSKSTGSATKFDSPTSQSSNQASSSGRSSFTLDSPSSYGLESMTYPNTSSSFAGSSTFHSDGQISIDTIPSYLAESSTPPSSSRGQPAIASPVAVTEEREHCTAERPATRASRASQSRQCRW